jgi:hypothetical protein
VTASRNAPVPALHSASLMPTAGFGGSGKGWAARKAERAQPLRPPLEDLAAFALERVLRHDCRLAQRASGAHSFFARRRMLHLVPLDPFAPLQLSAA